MALRAAIGELDATDRIRGLMDDKRDLCEQIRLLHEQIRPLRGQIEALREQNQEINVLGEINQKLQLDVSSREDKSGSALDRFRKAQSEPRLIEEDNAKLRAEVEQLRAEKQNKKAKRRKQKSKSYEIKDEDFFPYPSPMALIKVSEKQPYAK